MKAVLIPANCTSQLQPFHLGIIHAKLPLQRAVHAKENWEHDG